MLIVGARNKGAGDLALATGWHGAHFARFKRMPDLGDCLKPALSPEAKRDKGAREVKRMLDRMIAQQSAAAVPPAGDGQ